MAAKKYYAVKTGKTIGIFDNWMDCKVSVDGYPGAEYKGFGTLAEAKAYMGDADAEAVKNRDAAASKPEQNSNKLLAYVDGSYDDSLQKYAFGCVFLLADGRIYTEFGNGDNPQSLQHRNVTGEMLGAMYAVKTAMMNGFQAVEIRYDYEGIEKWVTGEWRSKTLLTQKYAASMRDWGKQIAISFQKVAAHTNVKYNEMADRLAKQGLQEGNGVPRVKRLEDMKEDGVWNESD